MKKIKTHFLVIILLLTLFTACKQSNSNSGDELPEVKTPVTITNVNIEPISETIELRGTSLFQKKVAVKANAIGYVNNVTVNLGDEVSLDQLLFTIETKEASALGNQNILKETGLNFSGMIKIKAQKSGIITSLDHQKGDYVQDGDQLGIISERNSLVFILEVPFELHSYLKVNGDCDIVLPDNQIINGKISTALPSVDAVSQTQSFVVKPITDMKLPENLIAKIKIIKSTKEKAIVLPKASVLADETQTQFWVMKLINDSTAIKIPVKKGIETTDKVEIIDPQFNANDRIILSGNYGLGDTAKIIIQK
jgi:multidrug efflux pump subunit AcrA (membrane-fusion protein)